MGPLHVAPAHSHLAYLEPGIVEGVDLAVLVPLDGRGGVACGHTVQHDGVAFVRRRVGRFHLELRLNCNRKNINLTIYDQTNHPDGIRPDKSP